MIIQFIFFNKVFNMEFRDESYSSEQRGIKSFKNGASSPNSVEISFREQVKGSQKVQSLLELPFNTNNFDPFKIPIKKISLQNLVFDENVFKITMKIDVGQPILIFHIQGAQARYTLSIKKQNLKTQYILFDTVKKFILIKVETFELYGLTTQTVQVINYPTSKNHEEEITIYPQQFNETLNQLKISGLIEKREKRDKKKKQFQEEDKKQRKKVRNQITENNEPDEEDSLEIKFKKLSDKKIKQSTDLQTTIRQMTVEEKQTVLLDIYKIKKVQKEEVRPNKCPVFSCGRGFASAANLKAHLKYKHPYLSQNGIELNQGQFTYSQKALDLALYLGKTYPEEIKKIIKKMKTKK